MRSDQSEQLQQIQRIQVALEGQTPAKRLRISLENYDEALGWYHAGALSIPVHQLPLLEQALADLRSQCAEAPSTETGKVLPFPGLRTSPKA